MVPVFSAISAAFSAVGNALAVILQAIAGLVGPYIIKPFSIIAGFNNKVANIFKPMLWRAPWLLSILKPLAWLNPLFISAQAVALVLALPNIIALTYAAGMFAYSFIAETIIFTAQEIQSTYNSIKTQVADAMEGSFRSFIKLPFTVLLSSLSLVFIKPFSIIYNAVDYALMAAIDAYDYALKTDTLHFMQRPLDRFFDRLEPNPSEPIDAKLSAIDQRIDSLIIIVSELQRRHANTPPNRPPRAGVVSMAPSTALTASPATSAATTANAQIEARDRSSSGSSTSQTRKLWARLAGVSRSETNRRVSELTAQNNDLLQRIAALEQKLPPPSNAAVASNYKYPERVAILEAAVNQHATVVNLHADNLDLLATKLKVVAADRANSSGGENTGSMQGARSRSLFINPFGFTGGKRPATQAPAVPTQAVVTQQTTIAPAARISPRG